jgi:hypothetical protein
MATIADTRVRSRARSVHAQERGDRRRGRAGRGRRGERGGDGNGEHEAAHHDRRRYAARPGPAS